MGQRLIDKFFSMGGHGRIQTIPSGDPNNLFCYQRISKRAVRTSFEKQLDLGLIASQGGSVPVFIRKSIATFDLPAVGGRNPQSTPFRSDPRWCILCLPVHVPATSARWSFSSSKYNISGKSTPL